MAGASPRTSAAKPVGESSALAACGTCEHPVSGPGASGRTEQRCPTPVACPTKLISRCTCTCMPTLECTSCECYVCLSWRHVTWGGHVS